ncbi:MAG: hypothetical protein M3328_16445 [Chloroflexota bacterium]|nr:hypothetical protein [Chloroflexota bacterium]
MKQYLGLAMVFALVVSVVPALAGESFHAFSQLPALEQAALTPLPDAQLATIEGTDKDGYKVRDHGKMDGKKGHDDVDICIACFNIATITQVNVAVGDYNFQLNAASVDQDINR